MNDQVINEKRDKTLFFIEYFSKYINKIYNL